MMRKRQSDIGPAMPAVEQQVSLLVERRKEYILDRTGPIAQHDRIADVRLRKRCMQAPLNRNDIRRDRRRRCSGSPGLDVNTVDKGCTKAIVAMVRATMERQAGGERSFVKTGKQHAVTDETVQSDS